MQDLTKDAARRAIGYLEGLKERGVAPSPEAIERLKGFDVPLQEEPIAALQVLAELDDIGSAATVASAGPRYFGFVTGGTLPAALAANYLAGAWDQNAVTDAHKWLNVPYDSGIVFVRDPQLLEASMASRAAYLIAGDLREPSHCTPELSRRARGVEIWAALRSLGRSGLADLIERNCRYARRFAAALEHAGYDVFNEVVLNQVLVGFGSDERTRQVVDRVQEDGTCWCGGTEWQKHAAMRISVSSWATTAEDVERSLAAIVRRASER